MIISLPTGFISLAFHSLIAGRLNSFPQKWEKRERLSRPHSHPAGVNGWAQTRYQVSRKARETSEIIISNNPPPPHFWTILTIRHKQRDPLGNWIWKTRFPLPHSFKKLLLLESALKTQCSSALSPSALLKSLQTATVSRMKTRLSCLTTEESQSGITAAEASVMLQLIQVQTTTAGMTGNNPLDLLWKNSLFFIHKGYFV